MKREHLQRIGLNSLWLFSGRLASQALLLLFTIALARWLGEDTLGQYAFVTAVVYVANVLVTFGLDTYIIREVSRERSGRLPAITAALYLQLFLAVLALTVIYFIAFSLSNLNPITIDSLRVYSWTLIPLTFSTVYSAVLRGFERMDLHLFFNLLQIGLQTAGGLLSIWWRVPLPTIMWVLVFAHWMGAGSASYFCRRYIPGFAHTAQFRLDEVWRIARQTWPLASLMVLAVTYQRLGIFLLAFLTDEATTGWFSAAVRLTDAVKMAPYAVFGALLPVMAHSTAKRSVQPNRPLYDTRLFWLLCFGIGLTILVLQGIAPHLINGLYGESYQPSIVVLQITLWHLLPFLWVLRLSTELIALQQERLLLVATFFSLTCAVIFYGLFIRFGGLIGASWAYSISELCQAVILLMCGRYSHQHASPQGQNDLNVSDHVR